MASFFTKHVQDFHSESAPAEKVLPELEKLLRRRMRRRNLLSAPPSYLGYGAPSWNERGAFEDIVVDCYVFAVLDRLHGLREQLRLRTNIDGLIVRNVNQFLFERQRRHDPIGYSVFRNVKGAAGRAEAAGELAIEDRSNNRMHNGSILRLSKEPVNAEPADSLGIQKALEQASDWDRAVPALVWTTDEGQVWVVQLFRRLREAGVAAVRVGDVVGVLAHETRQSWASRHAVAPEEVAFEGRDELGSLVRLVFPDHSLEHQERWERLKEKVPLAIQRLDRQQRVRDRLGRVFSGLVTLIEERDWGAPKQAELAERLEIARATLSDDFRTLKGILEEVFRDENPDS